MMFLDFHGRLNTKEWDSMTRTSSEAAAVCVQRNRRNQSLQNLMMTVSILSDCQHPSAFHTLKICEIFLQSLKNHRDRDREWDDWDEEIVALSGAHGLGACHTDRSGFWGPWTRAPTTVSAWPRCPVKPGGSNIASVISCHDWAFGYSYLVHIYDM